MELQWKYRLFNLNTHKIIAFGILAKGSIDKDLINIKAASNFELDQKLSSKDYESDIGAIQPLAIEIYTNDKVLYTGLVASVSEASNTTKLVASSFLNYLNGLPIKSNMLYDHTLPQDSAEIIIKQNLEHWFINTPDPLVKNPNIIIDVSGVGKFLNNKLATPTTSSKKTKLLDWIKTYQVDYGLNIEISLKPPKKITYEPDKSKWVKDNFVEITFKISTTDSNHKFHKDDFIEFYKKTSTANNAELANQIYLTYAHNHAISSEADSYKVEFFNDDARQEFGSYPPGYYYLNPAKKTKYTLNSNVSGIYAWTTILTLLSDGSVKVTWAEGLDIREWLSEDSSIKNSTTRRWRVHNDEIGTAKRLSPVIKKEVTIWANKDGFKNLVTTDTTQSSGQETLVNQSIMPANNYAHYTEQIRIYTNELKKTLFQHEITLKNNQDSALFNNNFIGYFQLGEKITINRTNEIALQTIVTGFKYEMGNQIVTIKCGNQRTDFISKYNQTTEKLERISNG